MKGSELIRAIETVAPPHLAEAWDNVGLLVGSRDDELRGPALLTIDLTDDVLDEAVAMGASALVCYHPPIFRPIRSLSGATRPGARLLRAVREGMLIYSPHTALDAATDGVTDWLADALEGSGDRRALAPHPALHPAQTHKLVTFVPVDALEQVRNALASAGAGRIGGYELCSFTVGGRGSFFGGEGTNPAAGKAGRLEEVEEIRLEMVCPERAVPLAIETLRAFHPYEEPAFDVYKLDPRPDRRVGAGRRVVLDRPASPGELAERVRDYLGLERVRLLEAGDREVTHVGVCPGSGAELIDAAIANECRLFLTGEMKHHELLAARDRGCAVILAGHTNTERGFLPTFAERLRGLLDGADVRVSERDRAIWRHV